MAHLRNSFGIPLKSMRIRAATKSQTVIILCTALFFPVHSFGPHGVSIPLGKGCSYLDLRAPQKGSKLAKLIHAGLSNRWGRGHVRVRPVGSTALHRSAMQGLNKFCSVYPAGLLDPVSHLAAVYLTMRGGSLKNIAKKMIPRVPTNKNV